MTDVSIPPDLWDDDREAVVSTWFFKDGERVQEGDVLGEVMIEKATSELIAPASGTLSILVPAESPVRKGQVVAQVR